MYPGKKAAGGILVFHSSACSSLHDIHIGMGDYERNLEVRARLQNLKE